ncbi:MAG: single-stranded DNA-binding protein [Sulfurimonas sp.]|nr:single-stranded DNA-binding protein [Sulfurimonas sp.]
MYNKVILVGRLTRDIELRYSQAGMGIASTAIATNHNYTSNGEKKEEVCYTDITFFARSAEIANQYLRKGSQILVEGRLKLDQWVDQNGQKRSKHSVTVETMKMLDSKGDKQSAGDYQQAPQGQAQQSQPQQQQSYQKPSYQQQQQSQSYQKPAAAHMPNSDQVPVIDIDEDEIPF